MRPPKNVTSSFFAKTLKSSGNLAPNITVRVAKKYKIKQLSKDLLNRSGTGLFSVFVTRLHMLKYLSLCNFPSSEKPFVRGSETIALYICHYINNKKKRK